MAKWKFILKDTEEIRADSKLFSNMSEESVLIEILKDGYDIENDSDTEFIQTLLKDFENEVSTESEFYILAKDISSVRQLLTNKEFEEVSQ